MESTSKVKTPLCSAVVIFLITLGVMGSTSPARADFESGWQAYKVGNVPGAIAAWTEAGEAGDARAQYNLGVIHDRGIGVEKNLKDALDWWHRAAQQDHRSAQHNIALVLIERGDPLDLTNAVKWLEKAAAANFSRSQYSLGKLYETGVGVDANETRAFQLISQAAKDGLVSAQYSVGKMFRDGRGTEVDPILAAHWFMRSAIQGYAKAQSRLATRYRTGDGISQNLIEALKWAHLSQAQGDEEAAKLAVELRNLLNPEEITEAESRAKNFQR